MMEDFEALSELESKQIEEHGGVPAHILNDLHGSIKFLNLAGNCIDLFVPKFLGALNDVVSSFENADKLDMEK